MADSDDVADVFGTKRKLIWISCLVANFVRASWSGRAGRWSLVCSSSAGDAVAVAGKPCRDERLVVAHQPVGTGTERVENVLSILSTRTL